MYLCPSFIIVQVEEELAKEKDNTAKLENTVTDLTSQCTISLQQTEEFRKEVKEKVSAMNCLRVKWQTDWFHGKLSGHIRSPLVNTRQQQRPYLLSKDVVRACLRPRLECFCRCRQPQKIASWLVSSVVLVSLQKKLRSLSFVSRCSHFRCGSQRLDCLILEVVICRGGRQITLFLLKHSFRSSMGLAHIVQFAIKTLRMTSEVTRSRKKRCYLNMNNHNIFNDFNLAQPFLYSVQSESLVALEAAKAAEKSVLDEQVRSSQETLQEKLKELSALQQQNVKVE